jgi:transposase
VRLIWFGSGGFGMPRPYSTDLRERALRACERGRLSRARIAALFGVGESTLYRWQQHVRAEGRREAKPHRGGPAPRLDGKALDALRALVAAANALTLAEYAELLAERTGVRVSAPTLCQTLKRLGLVRKKPSARPSRTGLASSPSGRHGAPSWPRSIPHASSFSTRAGSTQG